MRKLLVAALAALITLGTVSLVASPSSADGVHTPGSFSGYGFDTCTAPPQRSMDAWWATSQFRAVGIYISGSSRACRQPNLTRGWVRTQARRGWKLLPIHVGDQAPCFARGGKHRMSRRPATAYAQGKAAANESVRSARRLGIGPKSALYLDIEWYDIGKRSCNDATLAFIQGWTKRLHRRHYRSGVYSSASAAIKALDQWRTDPAHAKRYHFPDQLWLAWSNGHANTDGYPYLRYEGWAKHKRIHQYVLDRSATHGGVPMTIDYDFVDVGRGSVAPRPRRQCHTPTLTRYTTKRMHSRGRQVVAAKCLLKRQHFYRGTVRRPYFGHRLRRQVRRYQRSRHLPVTGTVNRRTWVNLLAHGSTPVLKYGHTGQNVYRLQRSLTAALRTHVPMTGVFDAATQRAVRAYRRSVDLPRYPVAEYALWRKLQRGRH